MTPDQLLRLALILAEVKGIKLTTVSRWATGGRNFQLFDRLAAGRGCNTNTLAEAAAWFRAHWPPHVAWPPDIPREVG